MNKTKSLLSWTFHYNEGGVGDVINKQTSKMYHLLGVMYHEEAG